MCHSGSCWSCWHIRVLDIVIVNIRIISIRAKVHKVGNVDVILVVVARRTILVFVNDAHVSVGGYAYEGIESLGRTDAFVSKHVVIRARPKDTREHNVCAEAVVEDFVADLAVGRVHLSNRVPRTVIDGAARAALVVGQRNPWNQHCAGTIEANGLGSPIGDSNGLVGFVVNEDASGGWDLAPNRSSAPLKGLGRAGARAGRRRRPVQDRLLLCGSSWQDIVSKVFFVSSVTQVGWQCTLVIGPKLTQGTTIHS